MISSRFIQPSDEALLEESLKKDHYHQGTTAAFFYAPGSVCNVYEDDQGPVLFSRGTAALRVDIQFLNNRDFRRNREVMLAGFTEFAKRAKTAGFTEIIFNTTSPLLRRFCERNLGFMHSEGELRKVI